MNRSCAKCGLIFKTETPRPFKLCHRCFIKQLETDFMSLIPHLWELSDMALNELMGLCNTMHSCSVSERSTRDGYISLLKAQVKKGRT